MSQVNWRVPNNFSDWKTSVEKRLANQERRFNPRVASDIMGPVLGPYAVKILDWNSDEAQFDGIIYSEPIALNAPEDGKYFMGWTNGNSAGFGLQWATEYRVENVWTPLLYVRRFWDIGDGGTRMFSEWVKVNADEREEGAIPVWEPVKPTGFTADPWTDGIMCEWDGGLTGGARLIVPGFRNLEILVDATSAPTVVATLTFDDPFTWANIDRNGVSNAYPQYGGAGSLDDSSDSTFMVNDGVSWNRPIDAVREAGCSMTQSELSVASPTLVASPTQVVTLHLRSEIIQTGADYDPSVAYFYSGSVNMNTHLLTGIAPNAGILDTEHVLPITVTSGWEDAFNGLDGTLAMRFSVQPQTDVGGTQECEWTVYEAWLTIDEPGLTASMISTIDSSRGGRVYIPAASGTYDVVARTVNDNDAVSTETSGISVTVV